LAAPFREVDFLAVAFVADEAFADVAFADEAFGEDAFAPPRRAARFAGTCIFVSFLTVDA
jgi:hypothetical protein